MQTEAKDTGPLELVSLCERAIAAMWRRAQLTLGDVTLTAIVDRVLYTASARFSVLTALEVDTNGVRFDGLKKRVDELDHEELAHAMRFVLVEFLTVLGHLTAEILTPALHAELSQVTLTDVGPGKPEEQAPKQPNHRKLVRRS